MSDPILKVAAKAVIVNDEGKVLIMREAVREEGSQAGLYGLPGGRLDPGERFADGLVREVMEETGLEVVPGRPVYVGEWRPVIKGVSHQIIAVFVACKAKSTDVKLSDEHDHFVWINPTERNNYAFMGPDDEVIAEYANHHK